MSLSDIISTKKSKSPRKSRGGFRSGNKVIQNTIKNTPEEELDTFCIIINHLTSKYRLNFFGTSKIAGLD